MKAIRTMPDPEFGGQPVGILAAVLRNSLGALGIDLDVAERADPVLKALRQLKKRLGVKRSDKAFVVELAGQRHTFDSFECAIHALAPTCAHCGCHVVGHGVEQDGSIFCCAHCAAEKGVVGAHDRI